MVFVEVVEVESWKWSIMGGYSLYMMRLNRESKYCQISCSSTIYIQTDVNKNYSSLHNIAFQISRRIM